MTPYQSKMGQPLYPAWAERFRLERPSNIAPHDPGQHPPPSNPSFPAIF